MTPSARSTGFESCAGPIRTERAAAVAAFSPRFVTTAAVKPVPCSSTGARTPATAMAGSTLSSESSPPEWLQTQPPSATDASSAARAAAARRMRPPCSDLSAAGVTSERVYQRRKIRLVHTWEHSRAASRPFPTSRGGRQPPLVACARRVRIALPPGVTSERVYQRRKIRLVHTWEHSRAASRPFPTSRGGRQPQAESRAGPLFEELEGAAGLLGEGAADVEAEARPRLAPGAERAEEPRAQLGRHSRAVVLDDGFHSPLDLRRGDADAPVSAGHCLQGIAQQVPEDLLERDLIGAHRRHFRREISLQRRALLRRLCLEKRPGRLHRLVEIAAGAGTRRTLPPSALHDELDALRLANDGRRTRAHRGVLRVRLEQELGAGADARQGLAQLVCQLGQQQRGVLLVRLNHAVSSGTEVEPPCLIADEDRNTLDLAAYGAGHLTRRAQAHAQLETPAPEREVEQRARAHARAQADDPLRTARPARRGGPGEGGNRACFDGGAPPAREGQPPAQQKGDRQREEVPRDVLGSA